MLRLARSKTWSPALPQTKQTPKPWQRRCEESTPPHGTLDRKERPMAKAFDLVQTRGLIFDCDGTLLNTMPAWNELEARFARMAGVSLNDEQLEELRAAPIDGCAAIFHNRYGLGESPEDVMRMMDEALIGYYETKADALPGVVALLEKARELGIPCVVVTSSPQRYVVAGLAHAGIGGFFRRVITTDDVGLSKQDVRIWQLALDVMGSTPETTWGFDDSVYAVKVMNEVGINTVGAYDCDETGTFEDLAAVADIAVHSLEELL
jgi:HAD superfamily hydrolase (TIGR01509 family)